MKKITIKKLKLFTLFLVAGITFLIAGCKLIDELKKRKGAAEEKPGYVISVHSIVKYPRAKMLEIQVDSFNGEKIWINKNPFLHARDIKKIELVRRKDQRISKEQELYGAEPENDDDPVVEDPNTPKFYDLKLYLTHRGKLIWMQISVGFRHEKMALLLDNIFYRSFYPGKMTSEEDEFIILEGPIDETCAKAIVKKAEFNYKHFNKEKFFELF